MTAEPLKGGLAIIVASAALIFAGCGERGVYGLTVVTDGDHRLEGDQPAGLVIAGGRTMLPNGARVRGPVWVLAGSLTLAGDIDGDLTVLGGDVDISRSTAIGGDVDLAGGATSGLDQAEVAGSVNQRSAVDVPLSADWESEQPAATRIALRAATALLVALLAGAFALLIPRPLRRVEHAVRTQPLVTLALGLLAGIVALPLVVFMAFTLVLVPLALLALLLLALALAYGWAATGVALLCRFRSAPLPLPWAAAAGAGALSLTAAVVELIPLAGAVIVLGLMSSGLGAVLLTRFGTRSAASPDQSGPALRGAGE